MKTKVLLVMVGAWICSVVSLSAQSVQTATLQKDDGVQVFYGADALVNSVNAAQDGNTIYLSAGDFNAVYNLVKSIKIIGSGGFNVNEAKNTTIQSLSITRNGTYDNYLELEGFVIKGEVTINQSSMVKMSKIYFKSNCNLSYNGNNIEFFSSLLVATLNFYNYSYSNTGVSNCIITRLAGGVTSTSTVIISNSIIYELYYDYAPNSISLQNNIIVANQNNKTPNSVNNNIFTGVNNFPSISNQSGNWENVNLSDLFVNQLENRWDPSYDYHLKNPANYIGTDGTQVGIYGGLFPWNPVPSNPQILDSKVNPTTTNDGKLNFQIKAEAQQ